MPRLRACALAFLGAFSVLSLGLPACRETIVEIPPQIMLVVDTDAAVGPQVTGFEHEVLVGGTQVIHESARGFFDGRVGDRLPGTIALVAGKQSAGALVTLRVWGIRGTDRVSFREIVTRLPSEGISAVPMPVQRACLAENPCDPRDTACVLPRCLDGEEVPEVEIAAADLPRWEPPRFFGGGDGDGLGATCFAARDCFGGSKSLRVTPERDGTLCLVPEAVLGVPLDLDEVNFAVRDELPATAGVPDPCVENDEGLVCFSALSARPPGLSAEQARVLAPSSYAHEDGRWVLPAWVCDLSPQSSLVVSGSCPQKTSDVPSCGISTVSAARITPDSAPTGFAGFPKRSYCRANGDACEDSTLCTGQECALASDCVGRVCAQKPEQGCFVDSHCDAGVPCEGATVCALGAECSPKATPGTCKPIDIPCFVSDECPSGQICSRADGCAAAGEAGLCEKRPAACGTDEGPAVCGCDLAVYVSACAAKLAGAAVQRTGSCAPCLDVGNGQFCATVLGYPASQKLVLCNGGNAVSEEICPKGCQTLGKGTAACN